MTIGAKVVLVEDELIVANSIAENLAKAGYEVTGIASSAQEALDVVKQNQPHLVLMDIRIKGPTDGVTLARQIREHFHIPIIFLTAHADSKTVERAKVAEPFGYLVKPLSHASLVAAIDLAIYKHDITRKLQESEGMLRCANRELEQFAYVIAHDLQEPLRNVVLASQHFATRFEGRLETDDAYLLKLIVDGSTRMLAMVRDLLAYSRAVEAEDKGRPYADSNETLSRALSNLKTVIEEKQANISSDHLPPVRMHEVHLLQIFQNLVGNSLKYSGNKPPRIHVSLSQRAGSTEFWVRDNGLGIPPEFHDRAFGLFKRLHGRDTPGTGIGLALCKRLVEHYGGKIWIECNKEEGTTLLFTPPIAEEKDSALCMIAASPS